MFFMHKIEHEWYDMIIGRYDINMTYFSFIMSYRNFCHLAKVSQNQESFNLGKYIYLNLPDLKNYLFWTDRTNSEVKTIWLPANAYFATLSQNPGWVENCFHMQNIAVFGWDFEKTIRQKFRRSQRLFQRSPLNFSSYLGGIIPYCIHSIIRNFLIIERCCNFFHQT